MSDSEELDEIHSNDGRISNESNSSSSLELHDINWEEEDVMFNYEDSCGRSPQINAVFDDDLPRLKFLLDSGKSVNVNDNLGNTPLHVSIRENKKLIFDYLLILESTRIDAENFEGITPLALALINSEEYCARELLKIGADVNLARNSGDTPLHFSVDNSVEIAQELVKKGALINAVNDSGETPLFLACAKNKTDHIHMLLYYGADATVPNSAKILPLSASVSKCPFEVQQILFDYTFDTGVYQMGLGNLTILMTSRSPIFYKVMEKSVSISYESNDLELLLLNLLRIKSDHFRIFTEKYENLTREFFSLFNPINLYKYDYFPHKLSVDFFYMLSGTDFMAQIVDQYQRDNMCSSDHSLVDSSLSEDAQSSFLFCLLSYGAPITSYDVNLVFRHYKYGKLFKLLLHQKIEDVYIRRENFASDFYMATLIYRPKSNINTFLTTLYFGLESIQVLSKFFTLGYNVIEREASDLDSEKFHKIPSLIEYSREGARQCLIEKYSITDNVQFFTILNWLPICQIVKDIMSYEKSIYP